MVMPPDKLDTGEDARRKMMAKRYSRKNLLRINDYNLQIITSRLHGLV